VNLLKSNDPCWCGSGRKYKRCHKASDSGVHQRTSVSAGAAKVLTSAATARLIRPGVVSPRRPVPPRIPRPDYAETGTPRQTSAPIVKDAGQIERMRVACRAAAEVLAEVGAAVAPGVTTDSLDALCHEACLERGGYPSPLGYHGYPKSLCTSVNEVICHGIPDSRRLEEGDIVNLDVTIYLDGMHGDTNATYAVGAVDDTSRRLIDVTRACLEHGIDAVRPHAPLHDVGRAIQTHAEANGFGVVRAFVGHGIGEVFHMPPQVPHYFDPRITTLMRPGMTFTIEPMITVGAWEHRIWDDGWTAVTVDGSRTAQFEHTVLVTEVGADVLTRPVVEHAGTAPTLP
jgi:methionyl aminopeptidase